MKYSAKTKPGMGDPYWYEWSVGQQYIIDMLNPDNNIKCVELQANVKLGLDDVVVTYEGAVSHQSDDWLYSHAAVKHYLCCIRASADF